jgi:Domain of unknown function (DUF4234)
VRSAPGPRSSASSRSAGPTTNTLLAGVEIEDPAWGIYVALAGSLSLVLASVALAVQTKTGGRGEKRIPIPGSTATAKIRSPWGVFALSIVTFGVYHLYWYYQANRELKDYGVGSRPVVSLLAQVPGALLIIPPFVSWWRFFGRLLEAEERAGSTDRVDHAVGFVLYSSRSSCCRSSSSTRRST